MTIKREQIVDIAGSVYASFLGLTLAEVAPDEPAEHAQTASATVHISGAWNGSVILSCSRELARRSAATMFQIEDADLSDGDVSDAFGELVNMIGGNLKGLLPEPSQLSLPTVSQGGPHLVSVPGAVLLHRVELECDGVPLLIAVWEQS